jgi:hypothetical protein
MTGRWEKMRISTWVYTMAGVAALHAIVIILHVVFGKVDIPQSKTEQPASVRAERSNTPAVVYIAPPQAAPEPER